MRLFTFLVLLVAALTLTVCRSSSRLSLPEGPPSARGILTSVRHSATASGLIVESFDSTCGIEAVADGETHVFHRRATGALVPIGLGAGGVGTLAVGNVVEVWADGPGMELCPMQGRAAVIVIDTLGSMELDLPVRQ